MDPLFVRHLKVVSGVPEWACSTLLVLPCGAAHTHAKRRRNQCWLNRTSDPNEAGTDLTPFRAPSDRFRALILFRLIPTTALERDRRQISAAIICIGKLFETGRE
jgi:hypothetical protein